MMEREYRFVDKTGWPPGEWHDEPDKLQFTDKATGLPCLIVRGPMGALCGYVGVPPEHPFHGKEYKAVDVACHGGLTFADSCDPARGEHGICHVAEDGEPEPWWLGFDCAHAWDVMPGFASDMFPVSMVSQFGTYKNVAYVKREIAKLAAQLKAKE